MRKMNIEEIKQGVSDIISVKEEDCRTSYEEIPEAVRIIREIGDISNLKSDTKSKILKMIPAIIDHTLLKPFAVRADIEKLCYEAITHKFLSVCVNSSNVKLAKEFLKDNKVKVSSAIGFPLGAVSMRTKVFEAKCAIEDGADELDVVLNIGKLKDSEYNYVYDELKEICSLDKRVIVKVIIENCYLTDEDKIKASYLTKLAGAHFVKTSTGFGTYGAKTEDIRLMRKTIGEKMGIKAAGGIKGFKTLFEMVAAGATRIGTSSSIEIIKG